MTARIGLAACVFRGVEMLAVARCSGFDFLLADMEHGAMSLGEVATLCVAGREAAYPVHVRVPRSTSDALTRAADCGAHAIVVPHVDGAGEARGIVDRLRFAPRGSRSIPSPIAITGFRPVPAADLVRRADEALEITVMIESAAGLAEVGAIAAVGGIDTLMVGANDLAQSLGHLGDLDHPRVVAAFRAVAEAARAHGRRFGVIGLPPELVASHELAFGAETIVAGNDIDLLFEACEARAAVLRGLARPA